MTAAREDDAIPQTHAYREPSRPGYMFDASEDFFRVADATAPAAPENDVCLDVAVSEDGSRSEYPRCPDCGGKIAWAEAGGVSGSRACIGWAEDIWEHRRWQGHLDTLIAEGGPQPGSPVSSGRGSRFADSRYHTARQDHRCPRHPNGG